MECGCYAGAYEWVDSGYYSDHGDSVVEGGEEVGESDVDDVVVDDGELSGYAGDGE